MATLKISHFPFGASLSTKLSNAIGGAFVLEVKQLYGPLGGTGWRKLQLSDGRCIFIGEKMHIKRALPKWISKLIPENDTLIPAGCGSRWRAYITANTIGCTCCECGSKYTVDFLVPDNIWAKIKPKTNSDGLMCGICMVKKLTYLNKHGAFNVCDIK